MRRESTVHGRIYHQEGAEVPVSRGQHSQAMTRHHFTSEKGPLIIRITADSLDALYNPAHSPATRVFPTQGFISFTGTEAKSPTPCTAWPHAAASMEKLSSGPQTRKVHVKSQHSSSGSLWPLLKIMPQNTWNKCIESPSKSVIFEI